MLVSHPTLSRSQEYPLDADLIYLMLHGDWEVADVFEGEEPILKHRARHRRRRCRVGSRRGCLCGLLLGALTVDAIARDVLDGRRFSPRTPVRLHLADVPGERRAGIVGCTGVHYSPIDPPLFHYGEPMHQYLREAHYSPAQALFDARSQYVRGIPHGPRDLRSQAIEYKIWRQFTCLGIGW